MPIVISTMFPITPGEWKSVTLFPIRSALAGPTAPFYSNVSSTDSQHIHDKVTKSTKKEIRNPNIEIRNKSEYRNPKQKYVG